MPNLPDVIQRLKKERERLQAKAEQLDAALKALGGLGSLSRGLHLFRWGLAADYVRGCA